MLISHDHYDHLDMPTVKADVMLPVHWGGFDLALHSWPEPIERVLVAAAAEGVRVATPRPGEILEPAALGVST